MRIARTFPCSVDRRQSAALFRDIGRLIDYASPGGNIAAATADGLDTAAWKALPPWVRRMSVARRGADIRLELALDPAAPTTGSEQVAGKLGRALEDWFSQAVRPFARKVFCIGWQKTGTTSLTAALRRLGLLSWHFAPWLIGCRHFHSDPVPAVPDFDSLADYAAVSDLPAAAFYRELDRAFPGSLFIFTDRPLDSWLASAQAHLQTSLAVDGQTHSVDRWAYGQDRPDAAVLCGRYLRHRGEVFDYFAGRRDFMALDLGQGNPWHPLCRFLGLPEPSIPFPHCNRGGNPAGTL